MQIPLAGLGARAGNAHPEGQLGQGWEPSHTLGLDMSDPALESCQRQELLLFHGLGFPGEHREWLKAKHSALKN